MNANQLSGILIADAQYENPRTSPTRAIGAHRIASLMRRRNVHVEVLDFFNSWEIDELLAFLNNFGKIDFLGISMGVGKIDIKKVTTLIENIKTIYPNLKIIVGGSNVTEAKFPQVDYYFKGFADGAIDDILKYLTTGKINPFMVEHVKTHDTKKIIDCDKHYLKFDLSNLKTEYPENDFIIANEALPLEASRGCVFQCMYCDFPLVGKKKNDYIREKEDIKSELISNYEKWGSTIYVLTDATFNDNVAKLDMMHEITKELPFKPQYVCFTRIDLLHSRPGTLEKMIDMGIKAMFLGIETFSTETSKVIRKPFTGDKLKNYILEIRNKYPDLHLTGSFIVGLPGESFDMIKNNLDWAIQHKLFDSVITFPLAIQLDNGVNYVSPFSKDWQNHGYINMSIEESEKFLEENKHYLIKEKKLNLTELKKHYVFWKSTDMNVFQAEYYATEIRKMYAEYNSISAFGCFDLSFSGIPLHTLLKSPKTTLNWDYIKSEATRFVNEYKQKKLMIKFN